MEYMKEIDVDGQTCVAHFQVVKNGFLLVKIQMPDGAIHPVFDMGFPEEIYALGAATRRAQRIFAANPQQVSTP